MSDIHDRNSDYGSKDKYDDKFLSYIIIEEILIIIGLLTKKKKKKGGRRRRKKKRKKNTKKWATRAENIRETTIHIS